MVFWRIRFENGTTGYQVMDDALLLLGLFNDKGDPVDNCGVYTTIDSTANPTKGLTANLPTWRNKIVDRIVP